MESGPKIGVLALQGNVREHTRVLSRLGADVREVRKAEELDGLDGLVIPGGESTAIGRLIRLYGLEEALRRFEQPVLGTCAGMILLARDAVDGVPGQLLLGAVDILVRRNGYGRQVASFEADLSLDGVSANDDSAFHAVFIRAPWVEERGDGVEVLAEVDGHPVAVREGQILAVSFHPEIAGDTRLHRWLLDRVGERA